MFKSITSKTIFLAAASTFLFAACSKSDDEKESAASGALSSADSILQYVPADTPYVFANVAPIPDELMDKLEPKIDRLLQSYQGLLTEVVAAKRRTATGSEQDREKAERAMAVVEELTALLSIEGIRSVGIGRDATGVIYGNGLLPVIRFELTDGSLFEGAITRLEEKAGHKMDVMAIGGHSVRYIDTDKVKIVIGVVDDQAVFTFVPLTFDEDQIGEVLGTTLPETNIAETGELQKIASEYGFTEQYVGFFDVQALAERFVGEAKGIDADLMALADYDAAETSEVCKAETRALAGIAPRIVMGYTEIGTDKIDSMIVVELRDDIAKKLQALPAAVPGLGGDEGGLMSFGMSIDVKAAREFLEARLDAMEANPFECEKFAELQAGVPNGRAALSQPLPPMVYDFKGFLAVIDEIEGLDVATKTPPTSVDGSFLLAMNNAQALVSLGTMFSPEIASMNLQPDGVPVALQLPQMQAMGIAAFAALTENALAVSVGEDSESQIETMLGAEVSESSPFMSFSMDTERYYAFLGEAMMAGGQQDKENSPSVEMQVAMNEVMQAVADVYQRMSVDVHFTGRGVEIQSSVMLQE